MNTSDRIERELISLEQQFGEALVHGDATMLNQLMDDEFIGINPLSQPLTKHQVIDQINSPDYELESLVNHDICVNLYGDVAVIVARGNVQGRYNGEFVQDRFRYTRIWVRRETGWRAVAAHATMIPK